MATTTRKRSLTFKSKNTRLTQTTNSTGAKVFTTYPVSIVGKQETTSSTNVGWLFAQRLRKEPDYLDFWTKEQKNHFKHMDLGSEFTTKRNFYKDSGSEYYVRDAPGGILDYEYQGELFSKDYSVSPVSTTWPALSYPDELLIKSLGTTAIARVLPTNPISDAMVFLGELRNDGFPSLIGSDTFRERARFFKNLGGEYLNIEFGWKPFVADIIKLAHAAKGSKELMAQYVRDSGRGVRRGYSFDKTTVSTVTPTVAAFPQPAFVTAIYANSTTPPKTTKTTTVTSEFWFSGCFTYLLNLGSSNADKLELHAQLAEKLIGLELTPETLWNLAPWSWAADWAYNIGDVLHNLAAFQQDGLVMRYGYMMAHSVIEDTYTTEPTDYKNRSTGRLFQTFGTEIKVRRKATPFGFGLSADGFTARQWAILAALGLSHGARQL